MFDDTWTVCFPCLKRLLEFIWKLLEKWSCFNNVYIIIYLAFFFFRWTEMKNNLYMDKYTLYTKFCGFLTYCNYLKKKSEHSFFNVCVC